MRWLSIVLALALSACSSWRAIPDDLTYTGLKLGYGPYKDSKRGEAVDVELTTLDNYNNDRMKSYMAVHVDARFCDQADIDVQGLGGLGLFRFSDGWIGVDRGVPDNAAPPYHYHTAIFASIHDKTPMIAGRPTILDYDLRENPRDLCLNIDAGTMWSHEKSNVVRIPKEDLIKLFAEHPRPPKEAMEH